MERRQNTAGVRVGDRELRRDVEVVAGGDSPVTHGLDDGVAERGLRVVRRRRVEVAVPSAESAEDGLRHAGAALSLAQSRRSRCAASACPNSELPRARLSFDPKHKTPPWLASELLLGRVRKEPRGCHPASELDLSLPRLS